MKTSFISLELAGTPYDFKIVPLKTAKDLKFHVQCAHNFIRFETNPETGLLEIDRESKDNMPSETLQKHIASVIEERYLFN